jgi:hypothetical protein
MTADTPAARVAAFAKIAEVTRTPDIIESVVEPRGGRKHRHDLRVSDLLGLLDELADACDDHMRCESCGEHLCETCGLGEIADCPAGRVHCASPWCFDDACADAWRTDQAAEAAREDEVPF